MLDITFESVVVHNTLLAFLFLFALLNLGAIVYLIKRCDARHSIHPDTHHLAPPAVPSEEPGHTPEPGLYFPGEQDEARALNEKSSLSARANYNPFKAWDIYSPEDTDGK